MEVRLPEQVAKAFPKSTLREFGIEDNVFGWQKYAVINLRHYPLKQVRKLQKMIEPFSGVRGVKVMLSDIAIWLKTIEQGASPKARNVRGFSAIVTEIIRRIPGHRVFIKNDAHGDAWLCYYVDEIEYHPEHTEREYHHPEYVEMNMVWEELGGRQSNTINFYAEDCVSLRPEEALALKGIYLETPERREQYLAEVAKFTGIVDKVGRQFLAVNVGTDDLDGNDRRRESKGWWWGARTNRILLDRNGEPSRVVIDIFKEGDSEDRNRREPHLHLWFWRGKQYELAEEERGNEEEIPVEIGEGITVPKKEAEDEDEDEKKDTRRDLDIEDVEERPTIEIPLHPFVATFDLKRQLRLRIHVNYLTEYKYDTGIRDRLVLPQDVRSLVEMLLAHKGVFKDIIIGKGGGAIVLCAGPPGTGKTLTAEVYSESMERPLYSVQCSQLGTDPNELEDELLKVFSRSQRWNAILLLDEADVYVHTRGNDLDQNAIVGVFLRVLEYYNGVLFLTTNRAELVDDAIASRCMARIDYTIPSVGDQKKIWRILSDVADVKLSAELIDEIVARNSNLSGRDIRNLIKLSQLVSESSKKPVTAQTVEFVKKFKPTESYSDSAPTKAHGGYEASIAPSSQESRDSTPHRGGGDHSPDADILLDEQKLLRQVGLTSGAASTIEEIDTPRCRFCGTLMDLSPAGRKWVCKNKDCSSNAKPAKPDGRSLRWQKMTPEQRAIQVAAMKAGKAKAGPDVLVDDGT